MVMRDDRSKKRNDLARESRHAPHTIVWHVTGNRPDSDESMRPFCDFFAKHYVGSTYEPENTIGTWDGHLTMDELLDKLGSHSNDNLDIVDGSLPPTDDMIAYAKAQEDSRPSDLRLSGQNIEWKSPDQVLWEEACPDNCECRQQRGS